MPTAEGDAVGRNVGLSALLTYILALISKRRLEAEETREREKLYKWTLAEMQAWAFVQRDVNLDNLLYN